MGNDVALTISSHDQEVIRSLQRTAEGVDKVVNRIERLEKASGAQSSKMQAGFANSISGLAKMAAGYISVSSAVGLMSQANNEALASAERAFLKYDEMFRHFRVQGALDAVGSEAAKQSILNVAHANATTAKDAEGGARQLVSTGFNVDEASGSALNVLLKSKDASNMIGGDIEGMARAAGQFLAATGMEKNTANLERVLVAIQRLAETGDTQLSDLTQLAGKISAFAGRMSPEEIMGAFDVIRKTTGEDKASTGLKGFGENLMVAKGDKNRTEALAQMGLQPEEVDFIGEDLMTVVERLKKGVAALPEADRFPAMEKLFGKEALPGVSALLAGSDTVPGKIAEMGNKAAMYRAADINQSGAAAAARRQELEQERLSAQEGSRAGSIVKEQQLAMQEEGFSPFRRKLAELGTQTAIGLGASPETAVRFTGSDPEQLRRRLALKESAGGGTALEQANNRPGVEVGVAGNTTAFVETLRANTAAMERNSAAIEKNSEATKAAVPTAPRTKAKPVSAGLGRAGK